MEAAEELQFRVRAPFVVRRERVVARGDGRPRERKTDCFWSGDTVALRPDEIRLHAHSLEPLSETAAAALEALHHKPAPAQQTNALPPELMQVIALTVVATVQALKGAAPHSAG